ncbi:MAG: metal-sensing transcriptional repressor [Rhodospirillaceae bacterium]|nr:metal-sensing transcriptional repressor [Rhodospirillaceae bacterium]
MRHESHPDIINRLKRADGHLQKIVRMLEEGRPCAELAQQLHAVEKAVGQAKRILVQDHVDHCLEESLNGETDPKTARELVREFKALTKYL